MPIEENVNRLSRA